MDRKTKVTKRTVDALKPGAILWDDEIPGFGVRSRAGGARYYFLKYRTTGGRQRWYTIGRHGAEWTPEKARHFAQDLKFQIRREGADPVGARQQKRHESTIAQLAERYLVEHVKLHNKASTAAEVQRIVQTRIKPGLGAIKITDLTRSDVKAWHQGMSATPYEANRALAYCSKMLSLAAMEWELRPDNPCKGVKRFPERARERFFTDDELSRLGEALSAAERDNTELPGAILLIRLLATTGMRLGEALALQWKDVDLAARTARLVDAKAGARTVHLGAGAVAILSAVEDKVGYVVRGLGLDAPLSVAVAEKAWRRLRNKARLADGRLHDLRHTAGTYAALAGANAFAVRDLLGHRTMTMTGRYVERAADMVRATADSVSNRVLAALNASDGQTADVVTLRRQKS